LNNLAVIARDQEEWTRAGDLSHESAALFEQLGDRQGVALSLVTLGAAEHHLGDPDTAVELLEQSLAMFGESDNSRELAECLQVMAALAHARGQHVEAAGLFGTAERTLEEVGSSMLPSHSPRYRRVLDEVCHELGDEQFADAWREGRATAIDDAVAHAIEKQQLEVSLPRSAGPNGDRRRATVQLNAKPSAADSLTRRELEVVALVARGLTNRQIADQLVIAERTAESHVCNALAKLGLRSRVQLTAWALGGQIVPPPAA
jgi:non-specific serine/threonine protein kinase